MLISWPLDLLVGPMAASQADHISSVTWRRGVTEIMLIPAMIGFLPIGINSRTDAATNQNSNVICAEHQRKPAWNSIHIVFLYRMNDYGFLFFSCRMKWLKKKNTENISEWAALLASLLPSKMYIFCSHSKTCSSFLGLSLSRSFSIFISLSLSLCMHMVCMAPKFSSLSLECYIKVQQCICRVCMPPCCMCLCAAPERTKILHICT